MTSKNLRYDDAYKQGCTCGHSTRCMLSSTLNLFALAPAAIHQAVSCLSSHATRHVQGRYSFVGAQPAMEIVARENTVTVIDHHTRQRTTTEEPDPMEVPLLKL